MRLHDVYIKVLRSDSVTIIHDQVLDLEAHFITCTKEALRLTLKGDLTAIVRSSEAEYLAFRTFK